MDQKLVSSSPRSGSSIRRSVVTTLLALAVALPLAGCGEKSATSILSSTVGPVEVRGGHASGLKAGLTGAGHLEGTIGPGALWSIDRPENWNGDLVVWLHGYTDPAQPITLPAFGPIRDALLARGYAVVASSYSGNGYAIKEATTQAHQLRGVFVSNVGQPQRTLLVGVSLGGLVGALLTEKYPGQYDGSLLVSGVVGGSDDELKYVGDVRVLFDAVYPGVLPGTLLEVPNGVNVNQALGGALAAIQANPQGVGIIAALARVKPEYSNGNQLVQSILTAIGFQLGGANDLLARTHGHSFFENQDWIYSGPVPQAVADHVNAVVARYSATPDAQAYVEHYGEPTGDLRIPVITLHNRWDPVVPSQMEVLYAGAVGAHGAGQYLLQRTIQTTPYGHVAILPAELVANVDDLAHWVDTGTRPAN